MIKDDLENVDSYLDNNCFDHLTNMFVAHLNMSFSSYELDDVSKGVWTTVFGHRRSVQDITTVIAMDESQNDSNENDNCKMFTFEEFVEKGILKCGDKKAVSFVPLKLGDKVLARMFIE